MRAGAAQAGARCARFRAALLALACAGACAAAAQALAPAPPDTDVVLVLARQQVPSIALLVEALHRREADQGTPRRRVQADIRIVGNIPPEQAVRELAPALPRYKAVFATTMALARATQVHDPRIPIVFDGAADPIEMCLVDSLHAPRRNATGYTNYLATDETKMVEALADGFPALRTVYVLLDPESWFPEGCTDEQTPPPPACTAGVRAADVYIRRMTDVDGIAEQAAARRFAVKYVLLCRPDDFELLAALDRTATDAGYVVPWQNLFSMHARRLVDVINRTGRPAMYGGRTFTQAGGLLSLEPIRDQGDREAAVHAFLQVLDGRSPAAIPVQTPRGFRLTLNAVAAARHGLQPSLMLMRRADEIVSTASAQ